MNKLNSINRSFLARTTLHFITGIVSTLIIGIVSYFAIINILKLLEEEIISISILLTPAFLTIYSLICDRYCEKRISYNGVPYGDNIDLRLVLLFSGILCVVWAIPALIIFWLITPENHKKATQVGIFFICIGFSILYYWRHPEKFPTIADKVSFFTGVGLGPVTVIQIFI